MASLATSSNGPSAEIGDEWADIRAAQCPLVIERRALPFHAEALADYLQSKTPDLAIEGTPSSLAGQLPGVPHEVVKDATALAERFARFMDVAQVRLRLERINDNACRKVHADYTDVRLLCTYAGPGTDYLIGQEGNAPVLDRMEPGWVGLFKGHEFAPGHPPAFHRSPPIEGSGEKRLLLVIDTPLSPELAEQLALPSAC